METRHQAVMTSRRGAAVPLKGVSVVARLLDLLAIVEIAQTYRNEGGSGIEAVYTFPLPPGATLLDLELTIGERRLRGQVAEKREAAVRYQLVSEYTNFLVVMERAADEAGDGMPELQVVPQMLAAGWGGAGHILSYCALSVDACFSRSIDAVPSVLRSGVRFSESETSVRENLPGRARNPDAGKAPTPRNFLRAFRQMCRGEGHSFDIGRIRADRLRAKAPAELLRLIDALAAEGQDERWLWLVVAWLLVATAPAGRNVRDDLLILLDAAAAAAPVTERAVNRLAELLGKATVGDWDLSEEGDSGAELRLQARRGGISAFQRKMAD